MALAVSPREYAAFTSIFCRYSKDGRGCCQARTKGSDYCGKHTRLMAKRDLGRDVRMTAYLDARGIWGGDEPITNIYIVRAGESGPVKVGRAKDVTARMIEIQVCNPEPVALIATFAAPESVEQRLHAALKEHHVRGEWFKWCAEIELIAALVKESKFHHIKRFVLYG